MLHGPASRGRAIRHISITPQTTFGVLQRACCGLTSIETERGVLHLSLAAILIFLILQAFLFTSFGTGIDGAMEDLKILELYGTDPSGKPQAAFKRGESLILWVTVRNDGDDLDFIPRGPIIWIELDYINESVPFTAGVQFSIQRLTGRGATLRWGAGFYLSPTNLPAGYYEARAYISDAMISEGGKFYNATMTFVFTVTTA